MANTLALGASAVRLEGSSPSLPTVKVRVRPACRQAVVQILPRTCLHSAGPLGSTFAIIRFVKHE